MASQNICPSHSDLRSEHRAAFVEDHLATCLRCRALAARLTPGEAVADEAPATEWFVAGRGAPQLGQLYFATTMGADERLGCIVVAVEEGTVDVVPLTDEVHLATHQDV